MADKHGLMHKKAQFSEWFSELIAAAELADLRYNVKGFLVHRPWSVIAMKEMYRLYEQELERKGHSPVWFPAVIPQSNFQLEAEHVKGFAPEVFWVTESGEGKKLEEKIALRPTSETAMYKMYALWIRSYRDLPLKHYQSCQVWRHETKATRPFIRGREFYWIETHCAFATQADAEKQVHEDMEIAKTVLFGEYGIPFLFLKRPDWDKFAGAVYTYAADCLMPDGRIIQQPSTHLLGQNFSRPFAVKYMDEQEQEQFVWQTVYGICIWRILASVVAVHGDDKGLIFPFTIAPVQTIIVPITMEKNVLKKCCEIERKLSEKGLRASSDFSDNTAGWKFNQWEMKGVPLRIEVGTKELSSETYTLVIRDTGDRHHLRSLDHIAKFGNELTERLKRKAERTFKAHIHNARNMGELEAAINKGGLVRVNFCSIGKDGEACADKIQQKTHATVRGVRVDKKEKPTGSCIACGKKGTEVVYVGKQY